MDLSPFKLINPCGYNNLEMTQINNFHPNITLDDVSPILLSNFFKLLNISFIK